ncbi:MAG TPA: hypothetical protein D7I05_01135 [Candidatus Poseidoniales archaeon]|nr:MAG TPA: hypothetical protein D7I05_01135 [Candidatus Poseidoniales archaeon]
MMLAAFMLAAAVWPQMYMFSLAGMLQDEGCDADAPMHILLSFDDRAHLDDWVEFAPMLAERNVVATFMLDRVGTMEESDWQKVQVLLDHGHALGYHGEHHLGAEASGLTPEAWVQQEVLPSMETFASRNLSAEVLAMPRGDSTSEHEAAVLEVVERVRLTAGPAHEDVTPWASGCGEGPVHKAVSLDERWGGVDRWLPEVLALREGAGFGVVHAYGHEVGGEGVNPDALIELIDTSQTRGWSWVGYDALP